MFDLSGFNGSTSIIHSTDITAIYYRNCLLFAVYTFKCHM